MLTSLKFLGFPHTAAMNSVLEETKFLSKDFALLLVFSFLFEHGNYKCF